MTCWHLTRNGLWQIHKCYQKLKLPSDVYLTLVLVRIKTVKKLSTFIALFSVIIKWIFFVGQFGKSSLAIELIYSLPNLIVFCNDLLMYNSKCEHLKIPQFESKIKIWLTVVEYTETLLEVSGKKLWGRRGKWLIIIVIQLFK